MSIRARRFFHAAAWFALPAAAGWLLTGALRKQDAVPPAPGMPAVVAPVVETVDSLHRRVDWTQPNPSTSPQWETYVRRIVSLTDAAELWRCYNQRCDEGASAIIQRRLVELDVHEAMKRALSDTSSDNDTWGEAFAGGWAVHQDDAAITEFLLRYQADLAKYRASEPHWQMRAIVRHLGIQRVLRLSTELGFLDLPRLCGWLVQELARTDPAAARRALGGITGPEFLAAARAGYVFSIVRSRPAEALTLLGQPEFAVEHAVMLRVRAIEHDAVAVKPVIDQQPELRKDVELMKTMAEHLGKDPDAAAWGNRALEGDARRQFLYTLFKHQTGRSALDTLALLPAAERIAMLKEARRTFAPELQDHPVLQQFRAGNITWEEDREIADLAKTDVAAALRLAESKADRLSSGDLSAIAISLSAYGNDPGAAWRFLAARVGEDARYDQYRYLDEWAMTDPAAAADWVKAHGLSSEDHLRHLVSCLAQTDEAKAREFATTLPDPAQQQRALRTVEQSTAWRELSSGPSKK